MWVAFALVVACAAVQDDTERASALDAAPDSMGPQTASPMLGQEGLPFETVSQDHLNFGESLEQGASPSHTRVAAI